MPKFPKTSPWVKELFASLIEGVDCEPRQMFGYPCAFVNGYMFTGVFGDAIFVRVDEQRREKLLATPDAALLDPMGGRPMRDFVQFSDAALEDEERLAALVKESFAYNKALPPKPPKPGKAKAKAKKAAAPKPKPKKRA